MSKKDIGPTVDIYGLPGMSHKKVKPDFMKSGLTFLCDIPGKPYISTVGPISFFDIPKLFKAQYPYICKYNI